MTLNLSNLACFSFGGEGWLYVAQARIKYVILLSQSWDHTHVLPQLVFDLVVQSEAGTNHGPMYTMGPTISLQHG